MARYLSGWTVLLLGGLLWGAWAPRSSAQSVQDLTTERERQELSQAFKKKDELALKLEKSREPVQFDAIHQEYQRDKDLLIGWDYVRVQQGDDLLLEADRVEYDQWTGDVKATGNVVIHFGKKDLISGTQAEFNMLTRLGTVTTCRAYLDPSVYVESDTFTRLRPDPKTGQPRFHATRAKISSCEPNPVYDWHIRAKEIYAHQNYYLQAWHPTFWLWRFPFFYLPYWVHPIKTERSTGLLVPSVGYSSQNGVFYKQGFFWAFAENADATIAFDTFSKAGASQSLDVRYNISENSRSNRLEIQHLYERIPLDDARKDVGLPSFGDDPSEIWAADFRHHHDLPWQSVLNAQAQYRNQNYLTDTFTLSPYQPVNYLQQDLYSVLSVQRNWSNQSALVEAQNYNDLTQKNGVLRTLPGFEYSLINQKLFASDIALNLTSRVENVYRQTEEQAFTSTGTVKETLEAEIQRAFAEARLRYVFKEIPWLTITPEAGVQETWWSRSKRPENPLFPSGTWLTQGSTVTDPASLGPFAGVRRVGEGLLREQYFAEVQVDGPVLFRIFDFTVGPVQRWKHLIEPYVNYSYTPEVTTTDAIDIYFPVSTRFQQNLFRYGVTQTLIGKVVPESKDEKKPARPQYITFAALNIEQTFDIYRYHLLQEKEDLRRDSPSVRIYRRDKPFSNILLRLQIRPFSAFSFYNTYSLDPYRWLLQSLTVDFHLSVPKVDFDLRWNYSWGTYLTKDDLSNPLTQKISDDDSSLLDFGFRAVLTKRWLAEGTTTYDSVRKNLPYSGLGITYQQDCWGVTVSGTYRETLDYFTGEIESGYDYQFNLHLKNIGDLGSTNLRRYRGGY